jgi:hypothetical protein
MGFAMTLTMFIWNHPERRVPIDIADLNTLFAKKDERYRLQPHELAEVLACAFWRDDIGEYLYSPWVQAWEGAPQKLSPIPPKVRREVRRRDMWEGRLRCYYCTEDCTFNHHFDHDLPVSRGGLNVPDNLKVSCPSCNSKKGWMTSQEFMTAMDGDEDVA